MTVYNFFLLISLLNFSHISADPSCGVMRVDPAECSDAAKKIPYSPADADDKDKNFVSDQPETIQSGKCTVIVAKEDGATHGVASATKLQIDAAIQEIFGCDLHSGEVEIESSNGVTKVSIGPST